MSRHSVVAGGAGFVGANLVARLLQRGDRVTVIDNMVRGHPGNLAGLGGPGTLSILTADLADRRASTAAFREASARQPIDDVWHLAANSDIPAGVADIDVDLKDTLLSTIEIVRQHGEVGFRRLLFASSSAIYGDHGGREIREETGPLLPISNYGAMKLASEASVSAAAEQGLEQVFIFRFPNVVGVPATHGVIYDFVHRLRQRGDRLDVLGNGTQQKAYLHVADLVDAMLHVAEASLSERRVVMNIGPVDSGVSVRWIAERVVARVAPGATIRYGSEDRGWVGDVPRFRYSVARLLATGWRPKLGSEDAVARAIDEVAAQLGA